MNVANPQYLRRVKQTIARHGWAVQCIGADPPWAYTVGLTQHGLPELLMKGRSMATTWAPQPDLASALTVATHVLNGLARRSRDDGLDIGVPYAVDAPLDLMRFRVWPIIDTDARAELRVARIIYGTRLRAMRVEQAPGHEHIEYALASLSRALRHIRAGRPDDAVEALLADFTNRPQTSTILRPGDAGDLTHAAHAGPARFSRLVIDMMRERKL